MSFDEATSQLFCGHRNGCINVWNLQPMLQFIERVAADPTASWFINNAHNSGGTMTSTMHTQHLAPSAAPSLQPSRRSSAAPSGASQLLSSGRRSAVTFSDAPPASASGVPIKDQLAAIAHGTRPLRSFTAHDSVTTLHVCLDPPALLSTGSDHVAHIWSLDGEAIGELDPVHGLARGYAMSGGGGAAAATAATKGADRREPEWRFHVDVATRSAHDRATTHQVLKSLETMAIDAQARQQQQNADSARSAAHSNRSPASSPNARSDWASPVHK